MATITFLGTGNFRTPGGEPGGAATSSSSGGDPGAGAGSGTGAGSGAGAGSVEATAGTAQVRYWNGFLLDGKFLVEVPPTALPHLRRSGHSVNDLDAVAISHFHPDHSFGWPFILFEMLHEGRTKPLSVIGPPGVAAYLRDMLALGTMLGVHREAHEALQIDYVEVDGSDQSAGELCFRGVEVEHVAELTCFGYVFERAGRRIGYSGDTRPCSGLDEIASSSDTLVLECNGTHPSRSHMHTGAVGDLATRFPGTEIVLTHVGAGVEAMAPAGVLVPDDFDRIEG